MTQSSVREPCEDRELSEEHQKLSQEQQIFKNYVQAMQDVKPGKWAALSVEEVQQRYAEGEIGDDELDEAIEQAMEHPDVSEDGLFRDTAGSVADEALGIPPGKKIIYTASVLVALWGAVFLPDMQKLALAAILFIVLQAVRLAY